MLKIVSFPWLYAAARILKLASFSSPFYPPALPGDFLLKMVWLVILAAKPPKITNQTI